MEFNGDTDILAILIIVEETGMDGESSDDMKNECGQGAEQR